MGGMQALTWAVDFPYLVDRVISVVSTGRTSLFTSVNPLKLGIDATLANKVTGLPIAVIAMTIQAYNYSYTEKFWIDEVFRSKLRGEEQLRNVHEFIYTFVKKRVESVDPYHSLYISRVCQLFTLKSGYVSFDTALSKIKAKVPKYFRSYISC